MSAASRCLRLSFDGWVELTTPIGAHVAHGSPLGVLHHGTAGASTAAFDGISDAFDACLLISNERSLLQDPGFGFRQLVDIAIRALSPSVNDPTTAVQVLDRLTDLLGRVAGRTDPTGWYADDDGVARVHLVPVSFGELSTLAFAEVIRYGADSPQVVRRLRAVFDELDDRVDAPPEGVVTMRRLLEASTSELGIDAFAELSSVADPRGLG